ncbi:ABC transporter ATP-binding protein [Dactylosporangium sp. NPDC005572]|uniref:ABC transporter ATP-binding protein n=1 Tax=Dactylosporangium sp. NPDC005572 TaxID=3156889 RepID=UPI0033A12464
MSALIEVKDLQAGYGSLPVVRGLNLSVAAGEIVALLGPNGAGKTTTLLTLAGELPALGGTIAFDGSAKARRMHRRAQHGLAFVTEDRSVFMQLTTAENLRVGRGDIDYALTLFPELKHRLRITAGLLSGGEQQMLTLARALSRRPRLLFVDELSLGLAPLAVERLLGAVRSAADTGVGVLLVEQHVTKILSLADRAIVMRRGMVDIEGSAAELRARQADIRASYLKAAAQDAAPDAPVSPASQSEVEA